MRMLERKTKGEDVKAWQTFLIQQGHLAPGGADGIFGAKTEQASKDFQKAHQLQSDGIIGPRTLAAAKALGFTPPANDTSPIRQPLANLHPELARQVARLVDSVTERNPSLVTVVVGGFRSFEEQNALFAKGRNAAGQIVSKDQVVTMARGGESYHNYGLAVDLASKRGTRTVWDEGDARIRGQASAHLKLDLEWGGNWRSFVDLPHFQLTGGLTVRRCQEIYNANGRRLQAVWDEITERLSRRGLDEELLGEEVE